MPDCVEAGTAPGDQLECDLGLQRGRILVSEYLALKRAMTAHLTENNQEQAYWTISELHGLLAETRDSSLKKERAMVQGLPFPEQALRTW